MSDWVMNWGQAAAVGAAVCGGKGWNLGRLDRYGFPVPNGGVLVAGAYTAFMDSLADLLRGASALTAREVSTMEAAGRLEAVRQAILAKPLPADIEQALRSYLAASGLDRVPVAVRSSATLEDGQDHSFAGIHQSFLSVLGPDRVVDAVKQCYASLWTPQAVAYRRRQNLADADVACAVVICAMVTKPGAPEPVSAGVAFSCDPKTGRRDMITISAAPGIGENVVSGSVNPEEIGIRAWAGEYSVTSRTGRPDQVLTEEQALRLARLVERVYWALGDGQDPQDVEWAFDGDSFWLLQSRPVTRLPRVTYPEVAHLPTIWSNANLKDTAAVVLSPLGWQIFRDSFQGVLYTAIKRVGYPVPEGMAIIRRFQGRPYFDLTTFFWANYDAYALTPKDLARALGGHQPEIPIPPGSPYAGAAGLRRVKALMTLIGAQRRALKRLPEIMVTVRQAGREAARVDLRPLSNQELLGHMVQARSRGVEFGPEFMLANMASGLWEFPLSRLVEPLAPGRGQALVTDLISGGGDVVSAEHGFRLFDLAAVASGDPSARAYLMADPLDPQGWKDLPVNSPFRKAMESFLEEFGHRAVFEVDLANPRWAEDPTFILEQVKHMVRTGRTQAPRQEARARRLAGEAELARLTFLKRPLIRWMADQVRKGSALRERAKSTLVGLLFPYRRIAMEVGRRLVELGHLDRPEQAFQLSMTEVELFLSGDWNGRGARALAHDRRLRDEAWSRQTPADIYVLDSDGRPAELPVAMERPTTQVEPVRIDGGMKGVGVSNGRHTGIARVLHHPNEGARLGDGEIMIAPSTDPGWTPLFLRAGAVVTQTGGYLSHSSIVSREYGLPCVVNVPGILSLVKDGQLITVDGDTGVVILHDSPGAEAVS